MLLSFSFVLLAALGAQAMPAKEGTVGLLALGVCIMSVMSVLGHYANQSPLEQQCTAFEGQCLVNGRREICNIGKVCHSIFPSTYCYKAANARFA